MTWRSVILGLLLGLVISGATYYNDFVIRQASLINDLLPISVLGFAAALLLLVNPLIGRVFRLRLLSGGEIGVVVALGLAACAWPGAGFFRTASTNLAMPGYWLQINTSWQAAHVMSYVPGGSSELAPGQVTDWPQLVQAVLQAAQGRGQPALRALWRHLDHAGRSAFNQASHQKRITADTRRQLLAAVNGALSVAPWLADSAGEPSAATPVTARPQRAATPHEVTRLNRILLAQALPGVVLPAPAGNGVLLAGGRNDPKVVQPLVLGGAPDSSSMLRNFPWRVWWPCIRLWGSVALLLGLASLCLAMIVHPQWSDREHLLYPIPRFLSEMFAREPGRVLPRMATQRLFWAAFIAVFCLHLLNGLAVWYPGLPRVPLELPFRPLSTLFPSAAHMESAQAYFAPALFLTVIAFAFFLNGAISFSLGIAPLAFTLLALAMAATGQVLDADYLGAKRANMLRFGGYVALAAMILYSGRHYYLQVARGALGLSRGPIPRTSLWAARGLVFASLLAAAMLTTGGLNWPLALACVACILIIFLVLSRIVAETGMFFIQPYWMPVAVLTALFGVDVLGPTNYIVLAMASIMLVGDTRTALMANLVNGLKIADRPDGGSPGRLWPALVAMILVGFVVAGAATLWTQYTYGLSNVTGFERVILPSLPFDKLTSYAADMAARGTLTQATAATGLQHLALFSPADGAYQWLAIGMVLVIGAYFLRTRWSRWPIHPVLFLVWGTYPANRFAFSFLLGWAAKMAVVKVGGARLANRVLPFAVGIIAGELAISFVWLGVGTTYFLATGHSPPHFSIF